MSEQSSSEEPTADPAPGEERSSERRRRPRALTPEQRRLLGKPRPLHERQQEEDPIDAPTPVEETTAPPAAEVREVRQKPKPQPREVEEAAEPKPPLTSEEPKPRQSTPVLKRDEKSWRIREMQQAALIIGALIVLFFTFYVGKKFDYWRYVLFTKNKTKLAQQGPDKFPNLSSEELVEQGLAAEKAKNFHDAAERFISAKHKNLHYRGILFRVAKMAYDRGDFDTADKLFERAIAFGENVDTANYFRGLIATRHRDLAAALRSFEAAANNEPFVADYYYYWAEALRLDHHPREAIARYEQAGRRARGTQDLAVCQFKTRMARLEAGEMSQLKNEIEKLGKSGSLSLDWLLTNAAIALREGRVDDAARILADARAVSQTEATGGGIFVSCVGDNIFQEVCAQHIELADICRPKTTAETKTP